MRRRLSVAVLETYALAITAKRDGGIYLGACLCKAHSRQEATGFALEMLDEEFPESDGYRDRMALASGISRD